MTAIINNVIVQGKPEEIKRLIDLYNDKKHKKTIVASVKALNDVCRQNNIIKTNEEAKNDT
jgi:hypothetical protein